MAAGSLLTKALRDDLDLKIEYASATINYYGWATPGTPTTDASWEIVRETLDANGRTTDLQHANNSGERNFKWSLRASYTYGP